MNVGGQINIPAALLEFEDALVRTGQKKAAQKSRVFTCSLHCP
jgi:hypothetical protein